MKQVKQYRIISFNDLEILEQGISELPICQLSIEAAPTTEFYINHWKICIGPTGVYEANNIVINSLTIAKESISRLYNKYEGIENQGKLDRYDQIFINIVYLDE